jgi:hypothetical protein
MIRIGINGEPNQAFYFNVDPYPGSQTNAETDPDSGQTLPLQKKIRILT